MTPFSNKPLTDQQVDELVRLLKKASNRNKPCVCKSGKKLKNCCLGRIKMIKGR